jgi:hypothetical protein
MLRDAHAVVASALGAENPRVAAMAVDLARVRIALGQLAGVEPMMRRALEMRQRMYPPGHWRIAEAQALLGASLAAERRYDEAVVLMKAAGRTFQPIPGRQAHELAVNRTRLEQLQRQQSARR